MIEKMAPNILDEARQYLEVMKDHVNCCGTSIIRKMLNTMELHAGDCLSLDNECRALAGEREELLLECSALRDALRKVALVHTYRPDGKGGTAFVKVQCEVCDAECGPDQMITHVGDCPLTVLNRAALEGK